jgi:3-oxoacyl-[acyl-carrier protein] reductase
MTSPNLHNRVALVTGGSRGIGAAVVRSLAGAGAAVIINYRERTDAAQSLVTAIEKEGGRAIAIGADVAQNDAVVGMFDRAAQAFGPVDILVNNAGIAITRNIDDLTEADFDRTIEVNLKSVFLCMQAALPAMRRKQWGRIINISSGAARGAGSIGPHYNASKAGIEGLTRGYAARLVKEGITVNAVAPLTHRNGYDERTAGTRRPDTARPLRNIRRSGAGCNVTHRQCLHDRPDHRVERRNGVQLEARTHKSSLIGACLTNVRCAPGCDQIPHRSEMTRCARC